MERLLFDIKQISKYLNIKEKTIYCKVESGEIPYYRIGGLIRFKKDEIDTWLDGCRKKNQPEAEQQKVKSNRRKSSKRSTDHFSKIITKTIDAETNKYYPGYHGESDRIEGPKQEVEHGSI